MKKIKKELTNRIVRITIRIIAIRKHNSSLRAQA